MIARLRMLVSHSLSASNWPALPTVWLSAAMPCSISVITATSAS
jgi:hypothetical protein